jgi:hypothetical protein
VLTRQNFFSFSAETVKEKLRLNKMERVEDYKKKPTKKSLYYRKRCYGMTSLDRISVEIFWAIFSEIKTLKIEI